MIERHLSCAEVDSAREYSFQTQRQQTFNEVARGLKRRKRGNVYIDGYANELPHWQGRGLETIIARKINDLGRVTILDVGCGNGRFLIDCKEKWDERIECLGITAFPYHQVRHERSEDNVEQPTEERLRRLGIRIADYADAQFLDRYFTQESCDVVTCVYSARYMADSFALLTGIHKVLKKGGIAFINEMRLMTATREDARLIIGHLQSQYGFFISPAEPPFRGCLYDLAFEKQTSQLHPPVVYLGIELDMDGQKLVYGFRETANSREVLFSEGSQINPA